MSRKKILQIITLSDWGGAQRVVFDLADNLDKEKFEVEVACSPGGLLVEKLRARDIKVHEIAGLKRRISLTNDLKAYLALKRLMNRERYDIVHCHSAKAGILGRMAAKSAKVKNIYYTVHSWSFYNKEEFGLIDMFFVRAEKIWAKKTKRIICVSKQTMADGIKNKISRPENFLVIENGIDFNVENKRDEIRQAYGIEAGEVVFAMVARLAHPKKPLLFLQAAQEFLQSNAKAKFILLGDGPFMEQCHNFVKENKLGENILLVGEKTPLGAREMFFSFDVFVLLSAFEGMPITVLEAMFAGLAVVASNVGGVGELVDEKGGFLVNNDTKEIAGQFDYLIKNPRIRREMGEHNQEKAQANFTLNRMVSRYEKLYLE